MTMVAVTVSFLGVTQAEPMGQYSVCIATNVSFSKESFARESPKPKGYNGVADAFKYFQYL